MRIDNIQFLQFPFSAIPANHKFYVYQLSCEGKPFYVGKGTVKNSGVQRMFEHEFSAKTLPCPKKCAHRTYNKIREILDQKGNVEYSIIDTFQEEKKALDTERMLIKDISKKHKTVNYIHAQPEKPSKDQEILDSLKTDLHFYTNKMKYLVSRWEEINIAFLECELVEKDGDSDSDESLTSLANLRKVYGLTVEYLSGTSWLDLQTMENIKRKIASVSSRIKEQKAA